MRVGCGSATIGMFATQWRGLVDEVVVVDDHITGVVSEHQAGKVLGWHDTGIKIIGRRSTPGSRTGPRSTSTSRSRDSSSAVTGSPACSSIRI